MPRLKRSKSPPISQNAPPKHTFAEKTGHLQRILAHFPSQILQKATNRRVTPLQPYEKRMIRGILLTDHKFYWIKHLLSALALCISRVFNVLFVYYAVISSIYELATQDANAEATRTGLQVGTVKILQITDTSVTSFECIMVSVFALLALMGFVEAFLKRGSTAPFYNWNRFWLNFRRCAFSSFQFSFSANLLFHTMGRMIQFVVHLWRWADNSTRYIMHRKYLGNSAFTEEEGDEKGTMFVTSGHRERAADRKIPLVRLICQRSVAFVLRFITIIPFIASSFLLLILLIVFGTAAVIVKLINIYQEALTTNIASWGFTQYFLIFGFLNQLSAASSMGGSDREDLLSMETDLDMQGVNVVDAEADEYGPYTGAEYVSPERDAKLRRMGTRFEHIYVYSFIFAMIGFFCGGWILVLIAGIALGFYFMSGFDQGFQAADVVTVSPTLEKITRSLVWRHAIFLSEFLATLYIEVCDTNLLVEMMRLMHIGDASNFAQKLPTHVAMDLIPNYMTLLEVEVYDNALTAMIVEKVVCMETGKVLMPGKKQKKRYTYRTQWDVLLTNPSSRALLIQGFSLEDMKGFELLHSHPMKSTQPGFHDYIFLPPYTFHHAQLSVRPPKMYDATKQYLPSYVTFFRSETQETITCAENDKLKLHRWIYSQELQVLSVENASTVALRPHLELFHIRYANVEQLVPNNTEIPPSEDVRKLVGEVHQYHQAIALITRKKQGKKDHKQITYRLHFSCTLY